MKTKLTDKGVKLALKLNKLVHNRCKDVPHDIGLQLIDIVIQHTRWISVSEKLPPKNELVSVRNDDCVPPYSHAKYLGKGKWDIAEIRTDSEDVLIEVLSVFEKFE